MRLNLGDEEILVNVRRIQEANDIEKVAALERRYAIDFADYFADALEQLLPLVEDGLVRIEEERIVVTSRGRLLLRNIAMCFDRYLSQPAAIATPRFSRAI